MRPQTVLPITGAHSMVGVASVPQYKDGKLDFPDRQAAISFPDRLLDLSTKQRARRSDLQQA